MKSDDPELLSLVRSAREGDRDGADRLCTAVRPHMLRIALALGADPDSAPDTVQESLWAAHRNLPIYQAAIDLADTFHLDTTPNRGEATRKSEPRTTVKIRNL